MAVGAFVSRIFVCRRRHYRCIVGIVTVRSRKAQQIVAEGGDPLEVLAAGLETFEVGDQAHNVRAVGHFTAGVPASDRSRGALQRELIFLAAPGAGPQGSCPGAISGPT